MKVALVTTPPSVASDVGSYAWSLVPHLRRVCEIEVFVASERSGRADDGTALRNAADLTPREFDHIVYQIGNDAQHAFMLPLVRALGGTVVLHDWSLSELCFAAYPAFARGGWSAIAAAMREGGVGDARHYLANVRASVRTSVRASARRDLALNRSVVRGGDAFIVHDASLKTRILVDRNAATPVAVLPSEPSALVAARYVEFLEACPAPRAKKKSLIRAMVEASDRRRREAALGEETQRSGPFAEGKRNDRGADFIDAT